MKTSWGTKASNRRKRAIRRTTFRWDVLGLQDPAQSSSSMSIEDIRRQIISASSQGLSPDTLSRNHVKDGRPKSRAKASASIRKRGTASK
jgi:hypothetical protein